MGKQSLFNDVESEAAEDVNLNVNAEFAARLEHNKRREELHRLQEKLASEGVKLLEAEDGEEDPSSSDDSDEDLDVEEELQDPAFLKALAKARGRAVSPVSDSGDEDNEEGEQDSGEEANGGNQATKKRKRDKPLLLKDLKPTEVEEDSEEEAPAAKPYARALEDSRRSFLQAAEAASPAEDDLFLPRGGPDADEEEAPAKRVKQQSTQELLDRYFGKDEELNEEDLFLKRFISRPVGDDDEEPEGGWKPEDDLHDEEYLEAADRFEAQHNFRFEEPEGGKVKTYPRNVEGVVRQTDSRRAEARARKKERQQEEKLKRQLEVQRLKNLKRQEIEDRLKEIQQQSGLDASEGRLAKLLESGDFDEAEYDKAMEQVFNEQYYEAEDAQVPHEGADEDGGSDDDEGAAAAAAGFKAARKQLSAAREVVQRDAAQVQRLLEECHKLDYEDIVAGMPTRFKYRQVEGQDYGLSTADILSLSDKELNQVVGLKKLAPYRKEANAKKSRFQTQHRLQALRQEKKEKRNRVGGLKEGVKKPDASKEPQDSAARRLATFARPQLKGKEARPKPQPQQVAASGLTKAQKRNMRRTKSKAAAKTTTEMQQQ